MFDNISKQMIKSLNSLDFQHFNYIKESIEQGGLTSPLVIRRFSDLAFSLARKSLQEGKNIEIAKPLAEIFTHYLNSPAVSIDTKTKMRSLISETKLDFLYASGNNHISSLRLAPYLITHNHHK